MFFEIITIAACTGAIYRAHQGTNSPSAKIGMYGLIANLIILVVVLH